MCRVAGVTVRVTRWRVAGRHDAWRKARIAALKVQVKKDITTNIVFANEAYISEGAIEHVVMTGQGSLSPEEKTKKIREMSPSKLLQSTNEQLADFFKEMEKYVAETVEIYRKGDEVGCRRVQGEGYVHSSKYVSRLLDAGIALALKYEDDEAEPFTLAWISEIPNPRGEKVSEKLSGLKSDIDEQLLAMRKSSSLPATAKAEVAVRRLNAMLNVTDIGEFTYLFQKLGTELNTRVRSRKDYQKTTEVEREKEAEYFALRERPLEERAMGTLQSVVPSGKTDRLAELSRALTDLRIDDGDALAEAWALADRGVSDLKESRDLDRLGQARQGVLGLKTFVSGLQRVNTEIHRVFTDHLEQLDEEIALATD